MASPAPLSAATITRADYANPRDAAAVVMLLNAYAQDPMGGGKPLAADVQARVVPGLAATPGAFSLLAWADGEAVALANCFTGFSTFAAAPLVNIHDMVVLPARRGLGIARALFAAIEAEARALGACKLTLEVLSGNARARALYAALGYGDYAPNIEIGAPATGQALFWQKRLI